MQKPLFVGQICRNSKFKRVEEKSSKHQLKIAVMFKNTQNKLESSFTTINFNTHEDLVSYEKEFEKAIKKLQDKSEPK